LKFRIRQARRQQITVMITTGVLLFAILGLLISGSRFVTDIKPQSDTTRMLIIRKSIESLRSSPVFGWGTQRNMEVIALDPEIKPLGSHSNYLAYLYRYGLVGFSIFIFIYAFVFIHIIRLSGRSSPSRYYADLGLFAGWAFVNNITQSLVTVMDFDVSLLLMIWMIWGLVITADSIVNKEITENPVAFPASSRPGKEIS